MNNTPETQKAVLESNGQWSFVLKECCERLEREREEARVRCAKLQSIAEIAIEYVGHTSVQQKLRAELKQELDEAREEVRLLKAILDLIKKDVS